MRRSVRLAWQLCPPTGREPDRAARKFVAVNFVLAPNRFHQAGGSHPGKCPRLPRISPSDGLGPIWLLNLNVGSTAGKRPTSSPHAVTAPPPPRWPSSRQSEADRHSRASVESRFTVRRTCSPGRGRKRRGRDGRPAIREPCRLGGEPVSRASWSRPADDDTSGDCRAPAARAVSGHSA